MLSGKNFSFNADTGHRVESTQSLWDSSPYSRLEKSRGRMLERANSFVQPQHQPFNNTTVSTAAPISDGIVVVVDPFSTGAQLAAQAGRLGYKVVRVFSIWDSPVAALIQEGVTVDYFATVQHNDQNPDIDAATDAV